MEAAHPQTPRELVFPPQVTFSWTLRGARARRREHRASTGTRAYRIAGCARDADELAAAVAFCRQHAARLELD